MAYTEGTGVRGGRLLPAVMVTIGLLLAGGLGLGTRGMVQDQERRLLHERTMEAALAVNSSLTSFRSTLQSVGAAAAVSRGSPAVFTALTKPMLRNNVRQIVLARPDGNGGFVAVAAAGDVKPGDRLSDPEGSMRKALAGGGFVVTGLFSDPPERHARAVVGAPYAPQGMVLYEEVAITGRVTKLASDQPFGELDFVVYTASHPDASQILMVSTTHTPLRSHVGATFIDVGGKKFLMTTKAKHPLVGPLATDTPWILAGVVLLITAVVTGMVTMFRRRRDYAMDLVEERTAELRESLAELEQTQEQLVRQERLAAIGEIASAVGHELRNPLSVITNALYLIRKNVGDHADERLTRNLSTADREVAAATLIVSDLLEFARARMPIIGAVDMTDLIAESLSVAPAPDHVRVERQYHDHLPDVAGDRDQLRQVLLNLITNGYEAMPEGGTLTIEEVPLADAQRIRVSDTGIGMDAETMARAFEPFFSKKARGVGIGLAVAKRIVENHGGTIEATSHPGQGTTFTVTLPVASSTAEVAR